MKAFPLIFSRTKNEDFVPDFLARPADLDVTETLKYVHSAMQGLDTLNTIRYTAFAVGNYCICGGIACLSKQLVQKAGILVDSVSEYLRDCKGRSLACFIGFAIPISEAKANTIPQMTLETYWSTYLEFLKHQWTDMDTKSEKLTEPQIDLAEKSYSSFTPVTEVLEGKKVIRHFEENSQRILDYYFNELLNNHNANASFISDILYRDEWEKLHFQNAAVSESLYTSLKTAPASPKPQTRLNSSIGSPQVARPQVSEVSGMKPRGVEPRGMDSGYSFREDSSKKKNGGLFSSLRGGSSGIAGHHLPSSTPRQVSPAPDASFEVRRENGKHYTAEMIILNALSTSGITPVSLADKNSTSYTISQKDNPELYGFLLQKIRELDFAGSPEYIVQISIAWKIRKIQIHIKEGV